MQFSQIYLSDQGQEPGGLLKSFGRSVQRAFPHADYVQYKNQEAEDFIRQHFNQRVVNAYHKLIAYALKADLARQCILLIKGGW